MAEPKKVQVAENIVSDSGNINLSMKLGKYIIGILITGIMSILGTSYGLYTKTEDNRKSDKAEIMDILQELKKEEVKPNTTKNYSQDNDIVRLFERVNSRQSVNTMSRPEGIVSVPPSTSVVTSTADDNIDEFDSDNN